MSGQDDGRPARTIPAATRREFLASTWILGTAVFAGCVGTGDGTDDPATATTETDGMETGPTDESTGDGVDGTTDESMGDGTMTAGGNGSDAAWRSMELTPVRGGDPFTVDGFDRPVVREPIAVWCPKCERQQRRLQNLDGSVVVVSLNTDPNEDASKVRAHAENEGFDWRFAVAPPEMTKALIDAFGPTVTNAPSTPVIVACQDGSAEFLSGQIHSVSTIEDAAGKCR